MNTLLSARTNQWNRVRKLKCNNRTQKCSVVGCCNEAIHISGGKYCLGHYVALPKCESPRCTMPADKYGFCKKHLGEKNDVFLYRLEQWEEAEVIHNQALPSLAREKGIYLYDCSIPNCSAKRGLRMTKTGIFCKDHFLTLPSCSEPGCMDPIISFRIGKCRDHDPILGQPFSLTESSVGIIKSSLSVFDNPCISNTCVDFQT